MSVRHGSAVVVDGMSTRNSRDKKYSINFLGSTQGFVMSCDRDSPARSPSILVSRHILSALRAASIVQAEYDMVTWLFTVSTMIY
jgi:hypothetical protein